MGIGIKPKMTGKGLDEDLLEAITMFQQSV